MQPRLYDARGRLADSAQAGLIRRANGRSLLRVRGEFIVECRDRRGRLKWRDTMRNLVVNAGLTYLEGVALLAVTQIGSWFVGITASAPTVAAADTMASHGGWTENETYSQATRPGWTGVAGAAGASSNSASPAEFSADGSSTAGGCFLTSNSTKGGTTGTLFSAVAFTGGDRALVDGDTLNCTYAHSVTDDGV